LKNICILGSTGSIGESTLDVIRLHPDMFKVFSLTAYSQIDKLVKQCNEFSPTLVVVGSSELAKELKLQISSSIKIFWGKEALIEASCSPQVDIVMAAIVGAAGLIPTIEAAKLGKRILLANKEALVMSGQLMMDIVKTSGAILLPIDSEHNAIFQCLPSDGSKNGVEEILLTASGGPFLTRPLNTFKDITPDEACAHPNWVMGKKISVDSATMMNKGLELIEAMWLFNIPPEKISILIHPQSVIHSMVRYIDGSVISQMGTPDMKSPISYGLGWPHRIFSNVKTLKFNEQLNLCFLDLDLERFPAITLAYNVANARGTAPTIMNAANELAVEFFLKGIVPFSEIIEIVTEVLDCLPITKANDLGTILESDSIARETALNLVQKKYKTS